MAQMERWNTNKSIKLLKLVQPKYGTFDADEQYLIDRYNALGLVLAEDANEMARVLLQSEMVIENILQMVTKDVKGVCVLPSQTFDEANNYDETVRDYIATISDIFKSLKTNPTYVVTVFALELGGAGHYSALVIDVASRVGRIFDSMHDGPYGSGYTEPFGRLVRTLFGKWMIDRVEVEPAIQHKLLSLEYTGGFPDNTPAELEILLGMLKQHGELTPNELAGIEAIKQQHTDSQNHFCYMWAIWYVDLVVHGKNLADIVPKRLVDDESIERLQEIHEEFIPISVIKKYIWCILHRKEFENVMNTVFSTRQEREFFNKHFMTIWYNPSFTKTEFHRYMIKFDERKNVRCFDNATPTNNGARDPYNTRLVREDL